MDRTTCIYASLYVVTIHMQMHVVQFLYFKKKNKGTAEANGDKIAEPETTKYTLVHSCKF